MATYNHTMEREPHIHGAAPQQYRQGVAVATGDNPPVWAPEMATGDGYQYVVEEWIRDLRRWAGATKVTVDRQASLVALSVGGAARTLVDSLDDQLLIQGGYADFSDGQGNTHYTGLEFLVRAIKLRFPTDQEALTLRTGLEFFAFTPRRNKGLQALFLRFDQMLERADRVARLGISFEFRTWMVQSVLRLQPKTWAELLKDNGQRFPTNQQEYGRLQQTLVRPRAIESNVTMSPSE